MSVRRHVLMCRPQFIEAIVKGIKVHTIRAQRARPIFHGDILDLRHWWDRPYASKQVKIKEVVCTAILPVYVSYGVIRVDGKCLSPSIRECFAENDGFASARELFSLIEKMHRLPFTGQLIAWGTRAHGEYLP